MPIYQLTDDEIVSLPSPKFAELGISERSDLQRLLRDNIDVIAPEVLVIYEEFGSWDSSKRRIDLLGIDKQANLVVIELKRTEDGGHMELQSLRYAAMVSTMSFKQATQVFAKYLSKREDSRDAEQTLLSFLNWDEPDEEAFAADVRIVLASAEFSKEITSTVLWLTDRDLDIRCVRIKPYGTKEQVLLDVQQMIPLPEAQDYQVKLREKKQAERRSRQTSRDLTKYDVTVAGVVQEKLAKNRTVLAVVTALTQHCNESPDTLQKLFDSNGLGRVLALSAEGSLSSEEMEEHISNIKTPDNVSRWFTKEEELIRHGGKTFALTRGWGMKTDMALQILLENRDPTMISCERSQA